jgi:hypothetical protein
MLQGLQWVLLLKKQDVNVWTGSRYGVVVFSCEQGIKPSGFHTAQGTSWSAEWQWAYEGPYSIEFSITTTEQDLPAECDKVCGDCPFSPSLQNFLW